MKKLKYIIGSCLVLLVVWNCQVDDNLDYLNDVVAPTDVTALMQVTQDNTGLVTITPNAVGASLFNIVFGDENVTPEEVRAGESISHVYAEGSYTVNIEAVGITGLKTVTTIPLVVSFNAPENLIVVIENDAAITKQVNVTANADFAISFEVDFGDGSDSVTANIGETASHIYQDVGLYTITIVAMGAAIETTTYIEVDFEVTAIVQPLTAAPSQPSRQDSDVVSIYSGAYVDISGVEFYPNWGQSTTFAEIEIEGDNIIQYGNLNYQGIDFSATPQDVSNMEFLHLDIWTADENNAKISPISSGPNETAYDLDLTAQQWTSFNIPLSFFTDQNPLVDFSDIIQFKFDGDPAGGTIFVDNLYFYKEPTGTITSMVEDFEGTPPTFTVFGNIAATEVISNPDPTGANTSANVARLTKTAGSEVWAGTFFEIATPLDLVTYNKINVKTWSPTSGAMIKLKLENSDASIVHEQDLFTTSTNTWENLLYDFSGAPAADYVRIVIFFDFGNAGDDSLYYYDDIELVNNDGGIAPLGFQDFEGTPPTFTVFGNIAATQVIANPDVSGINTTANVAQLTKTAGSEVWAGTFFEIATPLDLITYSKISVKTWSPINGAMVKLKIENSDASIVHEVDLFTSTTNAWEELVYDFSGAPAADYVRVVIFFDFGNAGDDSVYYFDEYTLTN